MTHRWYSAAILALLAVLAGLLIYTATGGQVPRAAFALLIFAGGLLRVLRDFASQAARNRSLVQLLISAVVAYLILTSG